MPYISVFTRLLSQNTVDRSGLDAFFENGESLPIFDPSKKIAYGRAWKAAELRQKSFEDLHRLWYVLVKERNLLATQYAESRRLGQIWFGQHRVHKCKLSMARIKTVLTERRNVHQKAVELVAMKNAGKVPTAGELQVEFEKRDEQKLMENKRWFRRRMNYITKRHPLL